jgi:hypothetical protein
MTEPPWTSTTKGPVKRQAFSTPTDGLIDRLPTCFGAARNLPQMSSVTAWRCAQRRREKRDRILVAGPEGGGIRVRCERRLEPGSIHCLLCPTSWRPYSLFYRRCRERRAVSPGTVVCRQGRARRAQHGRVTRHLHASVRSDLPRAPGYGDPRASLLCRALLSQPCCSPSENR